MNDLFQNKQAQKEFFNNFWEKEYYLFKNCLSVDKSSIDLSDLEDMATDDYFETRFITKNNNKLILEKSPETIEKMRALKREWTLIIHNLNLYNDFCHKLEKLVSFIPQWLFDDVMCTFSSDGSSLGAHIDRYNVFILQLSGKRKWELELNPINEYRDDCDIRVLKEFKTDIEHDLSPGDMIYIPPGVAHRGTSIGESLSLSIGFQSIEQKDIIEKFLQEISQEYTQSYVTNDSELESEYHCANEHFVNNLHKSLLEKMQDNTLFKKTLFSHLSLNKVDSPIENPEINFNEFEKHISTVGFQLFEDLKIIHSENYDHLYINGKSYTADVSDLKNLIRDYQQKELESFTCHDENYAKLLYELYQDNLLALE